MRIASYLAIITLYEVISAGMPNFNVINEVINAIDENLIPKREKDANKFGVTLFKIKI